MAADSNPGAQVDEIDELTFLVAVYFSSGGFASLGRDQVEDVADLGREELVSRKERKRWEQQLA